MGWAGLKPSGSRSLVNRPHIPLSNLTRSLRPGPAARPLERSPKAHGARAAQRPPAAAEPDPAAGPNHRAPPRPPGGARAATAIASDFPTYLGAQLLAAHQTLHALAGPGAAPHASAAPAR